MLGCSQRRVGLADLESRSTPAIDQAIERPDLLVLADAVEDERSLRVEARRLPIVRAAPRRRPSAIEPMPSNRWGARPRKRQRPPGSPVLLSHDSPGAAFHVRCAGPLRRISTPVPVASSSAVTQYIPLPDRYMNRPPAFTYASAASSIASDQYSLWLAVETNR